jgi:hypothetical protein
LALLTVLEEFVSLPGFGGWGRLPWDGEVVADDVSGGFYVGRVQRTVLRLFTGGGAVFTIGAGDYCGSAG